MTDMDTKERKGPRIPIRFAIVTVSDSKTAEEDRAGGWLKEHLPRRGFEVAHYAIVGETEVSVRTAVQTLVHGSRVDVVLTLGGTGLTTSDRVPEAVIPLLDKPIYGFGEIFRWLSFQEVGAAAMFSRALAGRMGNSLVFCVPDSTRAVQLALDELILPELDHLLAMVRS